MPIFKIQDPDTGRILRVEMDSAPTQEEAADIFASAAPSVGAMREMESRPVGQGGLGPKQPSVGNLREMESRRIGESGLGPMPPSVPEYGDSETFGAGEEKFLRAMRVLENLPEVKAKKKRMLATEARIGIPLLATAAFPPTAGAAIPEILALAGGYGAASAGGELVGQVIEGENDPRKVVGAAIRGAVPMPEGQLYGPMAAQAGANLTARYLEEGKITPGGAALDIGIPGTIAGVGSVGRGIGELAAQVEQGAGRARQIEAIAPGLVPTVGQVYRSAAPVEQRIASQTSGGGQLRNQIQQQADLMVAEINRIRGMNAPAPVSETVNRLAQFMGIDDATNLANRLAEEQNINRAIRETASEVKRVALVEAQQEAEQGIARFVQDRLVGPGTLPAYRAVQSGERMSAAANQLRSGIRDEANRLYAPARDVQGLNRFELNYPVPNSTGTGTTSISQQADDLMLRIPQIHSAGLESLRRLINTRGLVSHNELKEVRSQLYDFADYSGEALGTRTQAQVRDLIGTLNRSIADQAPMVLGPAEAAAIQAGDRFYAVHRPMLDAYAVKRLFARQTQKTGQGTEAAVSGILAQGLDAPEISNLLRLRESLQARGVPVPSTASTFADIRAGILEKYIDPATSNIRPNAFEEMAADLAKIERQTPGSLSRLGFGSQDQLRDFIVFLRASRNARSQDATEQLLQQGVPGWTLISAALDAVPNVRTAETLKTYLQRRASAGNPEAIQIQQQIRARALEELFITQNNAAGMRGSVVGIRKALDQIDNPDRRRVLQTLLGDQLINIIETQFVPGLRLINESGVSAGRSGSTTGGQAIQQGVETVERMGTAASTGDAGGLVKTVVGSLYRNGKYWALANLFAGGAGSAGLTTRAGQLRRMERILTAPGTPAERAIQQSIEAAMQPEPSPE